MRDLVPFLMFCGDQQGKAEEAVRWYCSVFPDSQIVRMDRYGPGDAQPEGTVRVAAFELGGHSGTTGSAHSSAGSRTVTASPGS